MTKYTLVQHSAVTTGHTDFLRAVELRAITDKRAEKIRTLGGMVFDDYTAANEAEDAENYPPGVTGLIPQVPGHFSNVKVDGSLLYIPPACPASGNWVGDDHEGPNAFCPACNQPVPVTDQRLGEHRSAR